MAGGDGDQQVRVPDDRLSFDDDLIFYLDGRRFTGIGYDARPGQGLSEVSYRDGMQSGPARDRYPSGQLRCDAEFWRNVRHGYTREFREDGTLISEKLYDRGVLLRSAQLDDTGRMVDRYLLAADSPGSALLARLRAEREES